MIKPLGNRVLISLAPPSEVSKGGIYIPPAAQEKSSEGTVVAVGPGRVTDSGSLVPMTIEVNDRVMYSKYAGTELKFDGVPHILLSEDEVMGVLPPSSNS